MIDWDGHGVYPFELLDSIVTLQDRLKTDAKLRFTYVSRTRTKIDGYVVKSELDGHFPIVDFAEYDPNMHRIFGITGRLIGSIISYEPLETVEDELLPDCNFAVTTSRSDRVFKIPSPSEPVIFHPTAEDK